MLSILKTLSLFSGSGGSHGPDLPSPYGRKFHISLHTLPDDGRSISRNVAEKRYDQLKNSSIDLFHTGFRSPKLRSCLHKPPQSTVGGGNY